MSALRVAVVSNNYPSVPHPHLSIFVWQLVEAWVDAGVSAAVIAPRAFWRERPAELPETRVPVLRPGFASASNRRVAGFSTYRLSCANAARAVGRACRRLPFAPQIAYGHFLFPSGLGALRVAERYRCPAVVVLGESDPDDYLRALGRRATARTLSRFAGVLSLSRENRAWAEGLGVPAERIAVEPNAVDPLRFHPRDRDAARARLGLPKDRPLVAFTGHFIERKGPLRVLEALRAVPEAGGLFLGDGPQVPRGEQVVHAGRVPNDQLGDWLCAADVYCMPTRAEGSPNAILEALACGLPIVSSEIPAVRETVPEDAGLRVDPDDVAALGEALRGLLRDPVRRGAMASAAREAGRRSNLAARAARIAAWLEELVQAREGS